MNKRQDEGEADADANNGDKGGTDQIVISD